MVRPRYRVETQRTPSGKIKYYLAKDVRVGPRKGKVKKYLGSDGRPSNHVIGAARSDHAFDLELRAIAKKADLSVHDYRPKHLDNKELEELEVLRFTESTFVRLMTHAERRLFKVNLEARYVYGSLSIDGYKAEIGQVEGLMRQGQKPDLPYIEVASINNYRHMLEFRRKERGTFSIENIRRIHSFLMRGVESDSPGKFRRTDSDFIVGKDHRVSSYRNIETELQKAIDEYYLGLKEEWHPFEIACLFHHTFLRIAPFTVGNGRVAREILQQMCMSERFPRPIITDEERTEYLNALRKADRGDLGGYMQSMKDIAITTRLDDMRSRIGELLESDAPETQRRLEDF